MLGDHDVALHLHHEVNATLKITRAVPLLFQLRLMLPQRKPKHGERTEKRGRGRHVEAQPEEGGVELN